MTYRWSRQPWQLGTVHRSHEAWPRVIDRSEALSSTFSSKFSSSFQLSNFPTFSKFFYGGIQSSVSSVSSISCVATFFLVKLQSSNVIAHPRLSSCSAKHARRTLILCAPISCVEVLLCRSVQRATHLRTQRGCAFEKRETKKEGNVRKKWRKGREKLKERKKNRKNEGISLLGIYGLSKQKIKLHRGNGCRSQWSSAQASAGCAQQFKSCKEKERHSKTT